MPASAATRRSSSATVGSSPNTSSPTAAAAMARRIAGVGRETVSLRRSTGAGGVDMAPVYALGRPAAMPGRRRGRRRRPLRSA